MRKIAALLGMTAGAILVLARPADAVTRRVPLDFATITAALAVAGAGDQIIVDPGIYSAATGETFPLTMSVGNVSLLGSGMGASILDAEGTAGVIVHTASVGGRIAGFTITGGNSETGGGIRITNGNVQVDHNLIVENGARLRGAGIFVIHNPTPQIQPWIHHNVLWDNFDNDLTDALDPHGIVITDESAGIMEHNLVGRSDGNGLLTNGNTTVSVRHNIFVENGVAGPPPRGRGICWLGTQPGRMYHNEFHANVVAAILWPAGGGNFSALGANAVSPTDSVFGNLDGDPLLVDANAGDFHLQLGSPAIDAGLPSLPFDPDGTVADLGPFYFFQGGVGAPEIAGGAATVLEAAPNPFRGATTISYALDRKSKVLLEIVDVRGRRVALLEDAERSSGKHHAFWNGDDHHGERAGAGVYFARVEIDGTVRTTTLVLMR